jgi:hypothetical protein
MTGAGIPAYDQVEVAALEHAFGSHAPSLRYRATTKASKLS